MATRFISRSSVRHVDGLSRSDEGNEALEATFVQEWLRDLHVSSCLRGKPYHGAEGFAFARTTFSARRSGPLAAAGGVAGPPKAADRMSGSSSLAVTSMRVPRGNDSGRSNQ